MVASFVRISFLYYHVYMPNDTSEETFCVVFTLVNYQTIVGHLERICYFPYMLELCYTLSSAETFPALKPI